MAGGYYKRGNLVLLDGTQSFQQPEDLERQAEIAAFLGRRWNCQLQSFGALCQVDWYALRYGRLEAFLELKVRSHAIGTYPTVFLNFRKWIALSMASLGWDKPAFFVVQFTDALAWIPLTKVDTSNNRYGGCARLVKSKTDQEPVVEVPISDLRRVRQ